MSKRIELLKEAITGEFNATRRYAEFARVAFKENLPNIEKLFVAFCEAEKVHQRNHLRALGENFTPIEEKLVIGTTLENIQKTIVGEREETIHMYPAFRKAIKSESKEEKAQIANLSMLWAEKAENVHLKLMEIALLGLKSGKDIETAKIWVCEVCGDVFISSTFRDVCPICGHSSEFYREITKQGE
jgi:rubrerythrin